MKWLTCLWLLSFSTALVAQPSVSELFQHSVYDHTSTGLSVREMSTGQEVIAVQSDKLLTPASSLKLLTTFVGLSVLGTDFRFETTLTYTGELSRDGTLSGDLYIIGGGDPTLGAGRVEGTLDLPSLIEDIAKRCAKAGITCIDGDVIVDTGHYGQQVVPDQWNYNDIGNYYGSGSWGINLNENLYRVYFRGGSKLGSTANIKKIVPETTQLSLTSQVRVAGAKTGDQAYIYGIPREKAKIIRGTIPQTSQLFSIKGALSDPPLLLAELVERGLQDVGIRTQGNYRQGILQEKVTTLHTYQSPPLSTVATEANRHSINLYCEAILKELGRQQKGHGSLANGIAVVYDYLEERGLPTDELTLKDGSGLASENKITPSLMTSYLVQAQQEIGTNILAYLPQVGKEGTVRSLLKGQPVAKHFYLKSGSFEGVQSYTGYVKAKSGKSYAICIMVNNYKVKYRQLKPQLEKLLLAIYTGG